MTEEKMITVPKRLLLDLLKSIPEETLEELLQELNLERNGHANENKFVYDFSNEEKDEINNRYKSFLKEPTLGETWENNNRNDLLNKRPI